MGEERRPVIVMIGGFLGSGKTTMIRAAAAKLKSRSFTAAAVFNDQGLDLVDTRYAKYGRIHAEQVSGGCFCCRFSALLETLQRLRRLDVDVIFAEAVGSCADISATVLQPLKRDFADEFRLAPYTVIVDPGIVNNLSDTEGYNDISFLFEKQVAEADIVCFNKIDLYREFPSMPQTFSFFVSALQGIGIEAWLNEVLFGKIQAGCKLLDIDYNIYARAEAKFAWLNCSIGIKLPKPLPPILIVGGFLDRLALALTANRLKALHLKVLNECDSGYIKASIQRNGDKPSFEGMLIASACVRHHLLVNARVQGDPPVLERVIRDECAKLPGDSEIYALDCFSPPPPRPKYRFKTIINVTGQGERGGR